MGSVIDFDLYYELNTQLFLSIQEYSLLWIGFDYDPYNDWHDQLDEIINNFFK
jgi:hypothetical protein